MTATTDGQQAELTIVGLGPGDPGQISRAAYEAIRAAGSILARTRVHPAVPLLEEDGILIESCDSFYESGHSFESIYESIVERVLDGLTAAGRLVYAVPGNPSFGERTVELLSAAASKRGVRVRIIPSPSFLDVLLPALNLSFSGGLLVLDAIQPSAPSPHFPTVYYQVYDRFVASDLKLMLLDHLPAETLVHYARAAGCPEQQLEAIPLHSLDHQEFDHLTTVVVEAPGLEILCEPARDEENVLGGFGEGSLRPATARFQELLDVMSMLRSPAGCPWDREQDHASLRRYVLEEAYEVTECIDNGELDRLPDELGDLLLQVVFHSQIASEEGRFDMGAVLDAIVSKLYRRHPHVFAETTVSGSAEVVQNWEALKADERKGQPTSVGLLADIPAAMPALSRADRVFRRAATVGFDWNSAREVMAKLREEMGEVEDALKDGDVTAAQCELGDLFLAAANLARWLSGDPEEITRDALHRFLQRFQVMERLSANSGGIHGMSLETMNMLWEAAKRELSASENCARVGLQ